ncbi:hypothetical protein EUTSA_v10009721mg [Eutrema salsugineum]|uniref:Sulfotransferase n=1 Tax=Eutrema salsugineum TaxID=72664 RepID=V4MU76_EUTSA|nr:cytosolic sulfotransferase 8 [Eutrema salsugineum]ESQ35476.1 hypothetical protein EUTSA_v10009721mg [Eutrema salsugineum]
MNEKEIPMNLRDEEQNPSEETKRFISSLPSDIDCYGIKMFKYKGCWYEKNILQAILSFQKSFEPQETDIIVASFPKSGTTWLVALAFALVRRSKYLSNDGHPLLSHNPHDLVPFLEIELYNNVNKSSKPDLTKFSSSSSPRLFSTHMSFHALQVPLKKESPCKIVYVRRKVKDVLVSLYHFNKSHKGVLWGGEGSGVEEITIEDLFESFCTGVTYFGPYWDQVLSYWRGSLEDPKHVLFMRYEELKSEPHAQIKRLAEFLECPFTEEEEQSGLVDKILELCSFRNLSGLEINKTGKSWIGLDFKTLYRRGEVGDSKNYLTPEMETKIDMITEEKLKGSGLKL